MRVAGQRSRVHDDRHDAGDRDGRAEQRLLRRRALAEERPVEDQHEHRHGRDDQRRDAARNALLRPEHETVADTRQQYAARAPSSGCSTPANGRGLRARSHAYMSSAGEHKARDAADERRHRLDGERDRQVRRAPDDVDAGERGQHASDRRARRRHRMNGLIHGSLCLPGWQAVQIQVDWVTTNTVSGIRMSSHAPLLYERVARLVETQISSGTLRANDRIPSVRADEPHREGQRLDGGAGVRAPREHRTDRGAAAVRLLRARARAAHACPSRDPGPRARRGRRRSPPKCSTRAARRCRAPTSCRSTARSLRRRCIRRSGSTT